MNDTAFFGTKQWPVAVNNCQVNVLIDVCTEYHALLSLLLDTSTCCNVMRLRRQRDRDRDRDRDHDRGTAVTFPVKGAEMSRCAETF